jgi:hypothetical protein
MCTPKNHCAVISPDAFQRYNRLGNEALNSPVLQGLVDDNHLPEFRVLRIHRRPYDLIVNVAIEGYSHLRPGQNVGMSGLDGIDVIHEPNPELIHFRSPLLKFRRRARCQKRSVGALDRNLVLAPMLQPVKLTIERCYPFLL